MYIIYIFGSPGQLNRKFSNENSIKKEHCDARSCSSSTTFNQSGINNCHVREPKLSTYAGKCPIEDPLKWHIGK
jgi:hypothetical protein